MKRKRDIEVKNEEEADTTRKDGSTSHKIIVGIDYGTTFTGKLILQ